MTKVKQISMSVINAVFSRLLIMYKFFIRYFSYENSIKTIVKEYEKPKDMGLKIKSTYKSIYNFQLIAYIIGLCVLLLFLVSDNLYMRKIVFFMSYSIYLAYILKSIVLSFSVFLLTMHRLRLLLIAYISSIFFFTVINMMITITFPEEQFNVANLTFIDNLYYSVSTITTLGYGDITPNSNYLRFSSMIEVLIGVTISILGMALLLSNKENDKKIIIELKKILDDKSDA